MSCRERATARSLNSLVREGLAYVDSADNSALRNLVHNFFGGEDPDYESPGRLPPLTPPYHNYGHVRAVGPSVVTGTVKGVVT